MEDIELLERVYRTTACFVLLLLLEESENRFSAKSSSDQPKLIISILL